VLLFHAIKNDIDIVTQSVDVTGNQWTEWSALEPLTEAGTPIKDV
jgi:hypothetical protein